VFASPHSGRVYLKSFLESSQLTPLQLRKSEDAFIDKLFTPAPDHGAPLLRAHFPRAYVDANREPFELDPAMFDGPLPAFVNTTSPRISAGLGTIPKVVSSGEDIYGDKIHFADARARIEACHVPYHEALRGLIAVTRKRFGGCLLIDCHSMPSVGGPIDRDPGLKRVDMVLGDRHGLSAAPAVTNHVERILKDLGFRTTRNNPYAGGFTTREYGRPKDGVHALQIEINRAIYMDENRIEPGEGMAALGQGVERLIAALAGMDPGLLKP